MTTLTLNDSGPSPDPLTVTKRSALTITNAMATATTVTAPAGLFNPPPGDIAAGASKDVTLGNTAGANTYSYSTTSPKRDVRSGTIDISN